MAKIHGKLEGAQVEEVSSLDALDGNGDPIVKRYKGRLVAFNNVVYLSDGKEWLEQHGEAGVDIIDNQHLGLEAVHDENILPKTITRDKMAEPFIEEIENAAKSGGVDGFYNLKEGGFDNQIVWEPRNLNHWSAVDNRRHIELSFGSQRFYDELVAGVKAMKEAKDGGKTIALQYSPDGPELTNFSELVLVKDILEENRSTRTLTALLNKDAVIGPNDEENTVWTAWVNISRTQFLGEGPRENPLDLVLEDGETYYTLKRKGVLEEYLSDALRAKLESIPEGGGSTGAGVISKRLVGGPINPTNVGLWSLYRTMEVIQPDKIYQFRVLHNGSTSAPTLSTWFVGSDLLNLAVTASTTVQRNRPNPNSLTLAYGRNESPGARSLYLALNNASVGGISQLYVNLPDDEYNIEGLYEVEIGSPRGLKGDKGNDGLRGLRGKDGNILERELIGDTTRSTFLNDPRISFQPISNLNGTLLDQADPGPVRTMRVDFGSVARRDVQRAALTTEAAPHLAFFYGVLPVIDGANSPLVLDVTSRKKNYAFIHKILDYEDERQTWIEFELERDIEQQNAESGSVLYYLLQSALISSDIVYSDLRESGSIDFEAQNNNKVHMRLREDAVTSREIADEAVKRSHFDTDLENEIDTFDTKISDNEAKIEAAEGKIEVNEGKIEVNESNLEDIERTVPLNRAPLWQGEGALPTFFKLSSFGFFVGPPSGLEFGATITKGRNSRTNEIEIEFSSIRGTGGINFTPYQSKQQFVQRLAAPNRALLYYHDSGSSLRSSEVSNQAILTPDRFGRNGAIVVRTEGSGTLDGLLTLKLDRPITISPSDSGDRALWISIKNGFRAGYETPQVIASSGDVSIETSGITGRLKLNDNAVSNDNVTDGTLSEAKFDDAVKTKLAKLPIDPVSPETVLDYTFTSPNGGSGSTGGTVTLTVNHFRKNGETTKPHLLNINNPRGSNFTFANINLVMSFAQFTALPVGAKANFVSRITLFSNTTRAQKDSRILFKTLDAASSTNENWRIKIWTSVRQANLNTGSFRNDNIVVYQNNYTPGQQFFSHNYFTIFKEDTNTLSLVEGIF